MKAREDYIPLPPVRKKVFRHSLQIVGLYVVVGAMMMSAVFLASGITPKAIHLNYDSIAAARHMSHAWVALHSPEQHPEKQASAWIEQFESALSFEESNVTEPGEGQLAKNIRTTWNQYRKEPSKLDFQSFEKMETTLEKLVVTNEAGMFAWAARSNAFSRNVFIVTVIVFFLTLLIALYLADGLAIRIAHPLRELSEALRRKPEPGSKLKLPEPNSLEMRILRHELLELWDRVSELQKLNLEQIGVQRQQLSTVLASVDDAILVLGNQEQVIHCNDGMLRIVGLELAEVMGRPWNDLSSVGNNYLKLRSLLKPEITSDKVVELEINGKSRVFSGRCRSILDEKQQQFGRLYLLHDITEIRHRDRLKTEFIGVLSHELKTPLQSLGTASELLMAKAAQLDEEGKMLIETVQEDVGRIRGVANEFVQVGLIDLHSLRLKIEAVPISFLVPQWIQPFQVLARDRGVKIEFVKEGCETITARVDPVKFPWAVTNLLSNAVRVSPAGSTVTVYMTDREKRVDIEIRDEGPGIPAEVQKRMFEPFFQGTQVSPIENEKTSGFLGLGLTITKEVVEAHEGEIHYFARQPHGSIFRISLPLLM